MEITGDLIRALQEGADKYPWVASEETASPTRQAEMAPNDYGYAYYQALSEVLETVKVLATKLRDA